MKKLGIKKVHIIAIIAGIIFVNFGIFHSNLWFDECYSVGMAGKSFIDIWNIGGHDVHPILYYWALHIINLLTNGSIMAYRIFSGIAITILGIMGYTHIRKDFGEKPGLIFSLLIFFSPVSAVFANEIRMYAWAMLLVTTLAIYAWRLAHEEKIHYYVIFFLSSLGCLYIHYYGLMAAGLINIVLLIYLIKNKKKSVVIKQIILGIIQGLLYLPWLIYFASQLSTMQSNGFWIQMNFNSLIEILGFTFSGNMDNKIGMEIAIPVYSYLIYLMIRKRKESKPAIFAVLIYVLIIIAALIMSKVLGTTILYFRYMFVVTGLMFFAIAYMYTKPEQSYILCMFIGAILIISLTSNVSSIKDNYDKSNSAPIEYLKSNLQEGDVILYPSIGNGSVLAVNFPEYKQYFFNVENWGVEEAYKAFGPGMDTYVTTDFLNDKECQGRIWVVTSGEFPNFFDETFNNENYKFISHEAFFTKYKGNEYQIHLVEKINGEE